MSSLYVRPDWRTTNAWSPAYTLGIGIVGSLYLLFYIGTTMIYARRSTYYSVEITSVRLTLIAAGGGLIVLVSQIYYTASKYVLCGVDLWALSIGFTILLLALRAKIARLTKAADEEGLTEAFRRNMRSTRPSNAVSQAPGGGDNQKESDKKEVDSAGFYDPNGEDNRDADMEKGLSGTAMQLRIRLDLYDKVLASVIILGLAMITAITLSITYFSSVTRVLPVADVNGCRDGWEYVPLWVLVGSFFYVLVPTSLWRVKQLPNDYEVLPMLYPIAFGGIPVFTVFLVWTYMPGSAREASFPAGLWLIGIPVITHTATILYPLYTTLRDEAFLSTAVSSSKDHFERAMTTPALFKKMQEQAASDYETENTLFELEMRELNMWVKGLDRAAMVPTEVEHLYQSIFNRYLRSSARMELNIPQKIRANVRKLFDSKAVTIGVFDDTRKHVLEMLFLNTFPKLLKRVREGDVKLGQGDKLLPVIAQMLYKSVLGGSGGGGSSARPSSAVPRTSTESPLPSRPASQYAGTGGQASVTGVAAPGSVSVSMPNDSPINKNLSVKFS
ncbi:hypothetical protein BC831DRAFT_467506 [Entophlyctis helioformis]|nr:hypothetical protein BC831DRAFT_467506 [Entophlyctis helioformis]